MSTSLRDLVALTKPRLSGLVVFSTGGTLLLAPRPVDWLHGLVSVLATALLVGAANALNSYTERDLDRAMDRTRDRPLPAGRLHPKAALALAFPTAAIALVLLGTMANPLTAWLGLIGFLSYVFVYTPMKVRSPLALWIGAIPGSIPPLMGWTIAQNRIEAAGLLLFAIQFFWQITHFIAIGVYRKHDYERAGFRILPLVVSPLRVRLHAVLWSALLIPSSLALAPLGIVRPPFAWIAALMSAAFTATAAMGLLRASDERTWAWRVFRGSLMYLTALYVVLGVGAA